jgi:hypothetical protein
MKLNEIKKLPQQATHGLDLCKWDQAVQFKSAKVEKYPLFANIEGDDYFFCMIDPDTLEKMAYLKALKIDDLSKQAFLIQRTWMEPKYRNMGLMTALYRTLHNQGYSLLSDAELSPESLSIWKTFRPNTKILDIKTKDQRDITDQDMSMPLGINSERFFMEGNSGAFGCLHVDNFMMEELKFYVGLQLP